MHFSLIILLALPIFGYSGARSTKINVEVQALIEYARTGREAERRGDFKDLFSEADLGAKIFEAEELTEDRSLTSYDQAEAYLFIAEINGFIAKNYGGLNVSKSALHANRSFINIRKAVAVAPDYRDAVVSLAEAIVEFSKHFVFVQNLMIRNGVSFDFYEAIEVALALLPQFQGDESVPGLVAGLNAASARFQETR